jgi:hypothetical protein
LTDAKQFPLSFPIENDGDGRQRWIGWPEQENAAVRRHIVMRLVLKEIDPDRVSTITGTVSPRSHGAKIFMPLDFASER